MKVTWGGTTQTDLRPEGGPSEQQPVSVASDGKLGRRGGKRLGRVTGLIALSAGSVFCVVTLTQVTLWKWAAVRPRRSSVCSEGAARCCWTSGSGRCLSATGSRRSHTGVFSSASACASPSWDPLSWTWDVRPSRPCSRSPGCLSLSSSSSWLAVAWEGCLRKRESG